MDKDLFDTLLFDIADYRTKLIQNGYPPVALHGVDNVKYDNPLTLKTGAGKIPASPEWPEVAKRRTTGWAYPETTNTGVLCDGLYVFDIDVDDQSLVDAIRRAGERHLGKPATERYRKGSSRILWPYRAAIGTPKKRRVRNDETDQMVEVLGEGNHFVAGLLHCKLVARPDEGYDRVYTDIEWSTGLDQINRNDLTELSEDQVTAFLDEVRVILNVPEKPTEPDWNFGSQEPTDEHAPLSDEVLQDLINHLPPANGHYNEWSCFISAIFTATGGSAFGYGLAHGYSRNSNKYDRPGVEKKWREVANSPTVHGVGFLINQARAYSNWLSPSARASIEKIKRNEQLLTRLNEMRAKHQNAGPPAKPRKMDLDF